MHDVPHGSMLTSLELGAIQYHMVSHMDYSRKYHTLCAYSQFGIVDECSCFICVDPSVHPIR